MIKSKSEFIFNTIAPVYGLFFGIQTRRFTQAIDATSQKLDLASYETILDVGCGTGALCSVLCAIGLDVTAIDPARRMLDIAVQKPDNKNATFVHANILEDLPFEDKSFDISIASHVAHGMGQHDRRLMYSQMSRLTRSKVIIYDYNANRSLPTTIIEWLEGGDYFHFIRNAESEMRECFADVEVINVGTRAAWYICTISA